MYPYQPREPKQCHDSCSACCCLQLDELEKSDLDSRQGLEADEKLVDLWRALGGSAERHSTGPAPMLSSRAQSVPDPTVFSLGTSSLSTVACLGLVCRLN